jgi:DNA mismatch repair protein MutS2
VNAHALAVLEFRAALGIVGARAASPLGRAAVEARLPASDAAQVRGELARVTETQRFLSDHPGWGMPTVPDATLALERLAVAGAVLEPLELFAVGTVLASARTLARDLEDREPRSGTRAELGSGLAAVRALLYQDEDAEAAIFRAVDAEGQVLDSASRELKRIRGELRRAHSRIVAKLEGYARSLPERIAVADASVTVREGRYVIPLRREGRGEVGGIVHGESATGGTVFVEPPVAIELMNELHELERAEQREIRRVLGELSARLVPVQPALAGAQSALIDFDALHARARSALEWRADAPEILDAGAGELVIEEGRHPLLLARADAASGRVPAAGGDVVPFDLILDPGERALVVSGPNTGGKSVFLKAIGLCAALAQAGVIPPVRRGTRLPLFQDIFADIGDEQSIAGSLSTFSAHLENLKEIVAGADAASLVLIDEMGTGTDPAEGAALARAILEELVARGALCVVTSHLGALKTLDTEGSGIVNASLQFDPDRMEPTYRLVKGRPGRSYGLAIARRLGMPAALLDQAEGHLSAGEVSVEELLETLERKEKEARELVASLDRERAEAERLRGELEARETELRRQERTAERRAREEARQLLMEARGEVEEAIREVRAASDAKELEEAGRRARARVEEAAREQRVRQALMAERLGAPALEPGQRVRLPGGATGAVVELREGRAVVEVGALRMELPAADLEPVDGVGSGGRVVGRAGPGTKRGEARSARPRGGSVRVGTREPVASVMPESQPRAEVDLRGLRVEEVELELARALDAAVLGDLSELRIIHGKGTGAVRARVQELLRADRRVKDFRLGAHGEGGAGVTVARVG